MHLPQNGIPLVLTHNECLCLHRFFHWPPALRESGPEVFMRRYGESAQKSVQKPSTSSCTCLDRGTDKHNSHLDVRSTYTCIQTFIHVHVDMYTCVYIYVYIYIFIHTCIYIYIHICHSIHIHTCIHACMRTCTRSFTHSQAGGQTCLPPSRPKLQVALPVVPRR